MAKKYNKHRPQKRNIHRRKLSKYQEEIARELGTASPNLSPGEAEKQKKASPAREATPNFFLDEEKPLF